MAPPTGIEPVFYA